MFSHQDKYFLLEIPPNPPAFQHKPKYRVFSTISISLLHTPPLTSPSSRYNGKPPTSSKLIVNCNCWSKFERPFPSYPSFLNWILFIVSPVLQILPFDLISISFLPRSFWLTPLPFLSPPVCSFSSFCPPQLFPFSRRKKCFRETNVALPFSLFLDESPLGPESKEKWEIARRRG